MLLTDSTPAISNIKNNRHNNRTIHLDVKFLYVKQQHRSEKTALQNITGDSQPADILTKAVGPIAHARAYRLLGLVPELSLSSRISTYFNNQQVYSMPYRRNVSVRSQTDSKFN
jgi:hypothetical protein